MFLNFETILISDQAFFSTILTPVLRHQGIPRSLTIVHQPGGATILRRRRCPPTLVQLNPRFHQLHRRRRRHYGRYLPTERACHCTLLPLVTFAYYLFSAFRLIIIIVFLGEAQHMAILRSKFSDIIWGMHFLLHWKLWCGRGRSAGGY